LVWFGADQVRRAEERAEVERLEGERKLALERARRAQEQREADLKLAVAEERRKREQREADFKQAEAARKLKLEQEERAKARRDAAERKQGELAPADVRQFRQLADEANRLFALQDPAAEHLVAPDAAQTEQKAEAAAAVLRPWGADLAALPLPAERAALKKQLYEVLLLLAETRSRRGTNRAAARDVLALLDPAAAPPP